MKSFYLLPVIALLFFFIARSVSALNSSSICSNIYDTAKGVGLCQNGGGHVVNSERFTRDVKGVTYISWQCKEPIGKVGIYGINPNPAIVKCPAVILKKANKSLANILKANTVTAENNIALKENLAKAKINTTDNVESALDSSLKTATLFNPFSINSSLRVFFAGDFNKISKERQDAIMEIMQKISDVTADDFSGFEKSTQDPIITNYSQNPNGDSGNCDGNPEPCYILGEGRKSDCVQGDINYVSEGGMEFEKKSKQLGNTWVKNIFTSSKGMKYETWKGFYNEIVYNERGEGDVSIKSELIVDCIAGSYTDKTKYIPMPKGCCRPRVVSKNGGGITRDAWGDNPSFLPGYTAEDWWVTHLGDGVLVEGGGDPNGDRGEPGEDSWEFFP